jgi:hypothetical protein
VPESAEAAGAVRRARPRKLQTRDLSPARRARRRKHERSNIPAVETRSVAIDMVTKSLVNKSRTTSNGVVTNVPVTIMPTLKNIAISSVLMILLSVPAVGGPTGLSTLLAPQLCVRADCTSDGRPFTQTGFLYVQLSEFAERKKAPGAVDSIPQPKGELDLFERGHQFFKKSSEVLPLGPPVFFPCVRKASRATPRSAIESPLSPALVPRCVPPSPARSGCARESAWSILGPPG